MTNDNATPRPWEINNRGLIMGTNGMSIHSVIDDVCISKEDAALIVKAVNSHDALLEACKSARGWLYQHNAWNQPIEEQITTKAVLTILDKAIETATK